jgi:hypothetical protein
MGFHGHYIKESSWTKSLKLRSVSPALLHVHRLIIQDRPLNMIVHLNVPDSVIMARIAGKSTRHIACHASFVEHSSSMGPFALGSGIQHYILCAKSARYR